MCAFNVSNFLSDDSNDDDEEKIGEIWQIAKTDYERYVSDAYDKVKVLGTSAKFLYLNDWWKMTGLPEYRYAKRQLIDNFVKSLDYDEETKRVGGIHLKYKTTLACMKSMVMMSKTKEGYESRLYFLHCEEQAIINAGLLELKTEELEAYKARVEEYPNLAKLFEQAQNDPKLLEDKEYYSVSQILKYYGYSVLIRPKSIAVKVAGAYEHLYGTMPTKKNNSRARGFSYQRKDWFITEYIADALIRKYEKLTGKQACWKGGFLQLM